MNPEDLAQSISKPVSPPPEVIQPQDPVPAPMPKDLPKKQNSSVLVILSLFLIVLVSIVSFLTYQNWQLQKQVTTLSATPIPTPSPTADPTANWRQITNKYWSFKAPPDLHYELIEPDENSIVLDPTIKSDTKTQGGFDGLFLISIMRITTPYPVPTTSPVSSLSTQGYSVLVSDTKQILVDGMPATYQMETQSGGQFPGISIRAYLKSGSDTYLFSLTDSTKKDLLDQILSTFKFIETASPTPAAQYTCPTGGYVDCMPVLDAAKQKACSSDAITWYKANCPSFKGVAM